METTIKYKGVKLDLDGDYIQAYRGGYREQSHKDYYETHTVFVNGIDITNLLNEEQLNECDTLAVETF
tara:strand:- start:1995 stop:2198 length:204 start_codon:yes stop_codon:yes gene_type:complete